MKNKPKEATDADYDEILQSLEDPTEIPDAQEPQEEILIDRKTGRAYQAGAKDVVESPYIKSVRENCEKYLHVFTKTVLNRQYLQRSLHLPVCNWLQRVPPFRKLLLLPREHAKTSIVSHGLPIHILIQPKESNIYFPGLDGCDCRIMMAGENERMIKKNHRVVRSAFENNEMLRSLWPHRVWEESKKQSSKWTDTELILPRNEDYPDASIFAIGVGGAIAGARPNVIIKDDLISLEARNSEVTMETAIEWHIASRALMDEYEKDTQMESLEYIIGTRWAVFDLYSYIIDEDPSVETHVRSIVEDGNPIWPERFDHKRIKQLQKEYGSLFYLLYMNSSKAAELSDFDLTQLRSYTIEGDQVVIQTDERDALLTKRLNSNEYIDEDIVTSTHRGMPLNKETWSTVFPEGSKEQYMRLKYR